MIPMLKSEFRKLFTVRSTYFIILICLAITAVMTFYFEGYRTAQNVTDPGKLASEVTSAAQSLGILIAIVGVLLVTHEYRYNTILYSLTSAPRRYYVLLAKVLVVSAFAIVMTLIVCSLSPWLTNLGFHAKGLDVVPQNFPIKNLMLHAALYGWGYSMYGLIIAFIIRQQVGVIATLFLFPGIVESLAGLVLKTNVKYMPFNTLASILQTNSSAYPNSIAVMLIYVAAGLVIAGLLFSRRDAN